MLSAGAEEQQRDPFPRSLNELDKRLFDPSRRAAAAVWMLELHLMRVM